jgi:hypothetical protein
MLIELQVTQNFTHKFVKIWQRDGSGTAKNLDEPIATAPSGFFICN